MAAIQQGREFWEQGRVGVTDLVCQSLLSRGVAVPEVFLLLGQVAGRIGEYATARRYLMQAARALPAPAAMAMAEVNRQEQAKKFSAPPGMVRHKFHLIKAWGNGFMSDMDHTLGHLLVAEMAGRIPVIHWGLNSLYRDADNDDAWTQFFEPVSAVRIGDLQRTDYSFYPAKWTAANLRQEEMNKVEGPCSKTPGVELLNQKADVTVGDFFTAPIELLPWLAARRPESQPGQTGVAEIEQVYRYLIEKYLKLKPWIATAVEQFATEHFQNRRVMAVHVRGSDKVIDVADLADVNQQMFQTVTADMSADPSLRIFLLTDDQNALEQYRASFPGRIITTDCARSTGSEGVHYSHSANRSQLGFEVLRDAYLAARCDSFVGLGWTNVSNFIMHLKAWPAGSIRLDGLILHHWRRDIMV